MSLGDFAFCVGAVVAIFAAWITFCFALTYAVLDPLTRWLERRT
jgi:hypothetical protein